MVRCLPFLHTDVGRDSWDLMYDILNEAHVLVIPGASFGPER